MVRIKEAFHTIDWGGGKSTELFIFPENADYQSRNFKFRLSTATVEVEESLFSPLDEVQRKLMVLEGEMTLDHEGHHKSNLKKFDVDEFDGGWKTNSKGCCIDFNLMLREGSKGSLNGINLTQDQTISGEFFGNHFFIWVYSGEVDLEVENQLYSLKEKALIYFSDALSGRIEIKAKAESDLVLVDII